MLSVVVPCYNESARLAGTFEGLDRLVSALGEAPEVLLVDDGSEDRTLALARELAADRPWVQVIAAPHRGKGGAIRQGVRRSTGDWVVLADADWSVSPEALLALLPPLGPAADVVVGSREEDGAVRRDEPTYRHLLGRGFNALVQLLLPGVEDSQCGYKALRGPAARRLFDRCRLDGWAFDVELLYLARRWGLAVETVPVEWTFREDSRVRPARDAPRMAIDLARIALNARRGRYDP